MEQYRTLRGPAQAEFTERRSRFIGEARPVRTQEEAAAFLGELRARYRDATHHVSAWLLRAGLLQRYSDDGEPQGTAGVPVLEVLRREGLTDCAVIVTRYFGGVLLGAGGLVRAYSHAAKLAVDAAGIVTMCACRRLCVRCGYEFYDRLRGLILTDGGVVEDARFADAVEVVLYLPAAQADAFTLHLADATGNHAVIEPLGVCFAAI